MMSCSICGSTRMASSVNYGAIPLCDAYDPDRAAAMAVPRFVVDAFTCGDCGHGELGDKPPEEQIYPNYKYFSSNSTDLSEHFASYASWLKDKLNLKPGALHLDVGCNDGLLLEKSRAAGWKTKGIDPSPAAARAQAKGLDVIHGYLSEQMVEERGLGGIADVITCNNVIANIRDLNSFGRSLARMLKPDGHLVVETLHYAMVLRNFVIEMVNHEHYHYYSVNSMRRLFENFGLELISCEHVATKGANMRCIGRKATGSVRPTPTVDAALAENDFAGDLARFRQTLAHTTATIKDMIKEARARGPVAGFGSAASTTTLMYVLGIQDEIDYLVDDNPSRHGYFAPGSGLKVISPSQYYASNPALSIIFAWRFGAQIANKHRSKMPGEHRFVMANTGASI